MNDNSFMDASAMMVRVMENLDPDKIKQGKKVFTLWKQIVESIKSNSINGQNIGKNMASHSRIIDLDNGILLVEADHPGWIQMIETYKRYILKGFQMKAPKLKIESLAFRLAGTNAELYKIQKESEEKKERKMEENKIEKEQKELEKKGFTYKLRKQKDEGKKRLPSNLQKIFDDIKNDMLTKTN